MISHIHHINFIVRNLENSIEQYQSMLGLGQFTIDALPKRGVKTARIKLGETWLVLVEPLEADSVPGRHLKEHGEGFFLLSLATDNIDDSLIAFHTKTNHQQDIKKRQGLENWVVADFPEDLFFGAQFQLTQETTQ